jgi:galactokinase
VSDFAQLFGREPEFTANAPGRVNLIGEHTEYNGGYVLPVALPLLTRVELAVRADRTVQAASTAEAAWRQPVSYDLRDEHPSGTWIDAVQGVTHALEADGRIVPGFDLLVSSQVPLGCGLSSSAALEVAVMRALRMACGWALDDLEVARLAHRGERDRGHRPVGMMSPMACSLGQPSHALFIQSATLEMLQIPMPTSVEVGIVDSGISRPNVEGRYAERREECERAASALGVASLSALSLRDLSRVAQLPPPLDRRARHVVTENVRVLQSVGALTADQPATIGALIRASHRSLSADFEVSLPAIDRLVGFANDEPLVFGARLTGAGFGGAILLLCRAGSALTAARHVAQRARPDGELRPRVVLPVDRHET